MDIDRSALVEVIFQIHDFFCDEHNSEHLWQNSGMRTIEK